MIQELKPYSSYKDSGVKWLGDVPEHWEVRRLKHCASRFFAGGTPDSGNPLYYCEPDFGIPWLMISDMTMKRRVYGTFKAITEEGRASRNLEVLPAGTVLYSMYASLGTVSLLEIDAAINQAILGIQPNLPQLSSQFCLYYLESLRPYVIQMARSSTQANLNAEKVRSLPMFLPPLPEQNTIVRFLNYADNRIRRSIHAKQKLIKLLEEEKQAIIHHAVTRGLDPDVPLKPSGVEWLGDVPEHWEVKPAKFFFREVDERSTTGIEELLSVSHITGVTPRSQKNITMFMAESNVGHKLCRPGDLVINTMWAWMAALGVSEQVGLVSPSYGVYRPLKNSQLLSDYVDLLLRSAPYRAEYLCRSTGIRSSRLRLYPEQFLKIKLICPPVDEQNVILQSLKKGTVETDNIITTTKKEITLLREYRTRLIADVVTGKLDVREAAANLPDEDNDEDAFTDDDAAAGIEMAGIDECECECECESESEGEFECGSEPGE